MLSHVTPWTVALQAPLSMEFSGQEYWNELPFPPPGDLLYSGIEIKSRMSSTLAGKVFFLTTEPPKKSHKMIRESVSEISQI